MVENRQTEIFAAPPIRQKQGEWMGHGALLRERTEGESGFT